MAESAQAARRQGGRVLGWGLWNERLNEWFNPGTARPYFPTREAALALLVRARRQYPMGTWELSEYRLEVDEEEEASPVDSQVR